MITIIGGGPAGFFAACIIKHFKQDSDVCILEQAAQPLQKLAVTGGGRCNLTHACFDIKKLITFYPRGGKELIGPFHRFGPQETINWFEEHKVPLHTEEDGRIFPTSNSSQTVIDCLMNEAKKMGVAIRTKCKVLDVQQTSTGCFELSIEGEKPIQTDLLLITTGGALSPFSWLKQLKHTIVPPVPSLFTFTCNNSTIHSLSGTAIEKVKISMNKKEVEGSLLITHEGFSGPAVLKLSSFLARTLNETNHRGELQINWLCDKNEAEVFDILERNKASFPTRRAFIPYMLPKKLWRFLLESIGIGEETLFGAVPKKELHKLAQKLTSDRYTITGKNTHKGEFVTCGGVALHEVNFQTMESKIVPNLYFAGEVLDIDALTGGFNLQNAWTTAYIAATAISGVYI